MPKKEKENFDPQKIPQIPQKRYWSWESQTDGHIFLVPTSFAAKTTGSRPGSNVDISEAFGIGDFNILSKFI